MKSMPARAGSAALLLAGTLLLTAGCGGGGDNGDGGAEAASPPVSAGSPTPSAGTSAPTGTAAPQTTHAPPGSVLPTAPATPKPGPKVTRPTTAPSKVVTAFARCMRAHGIDVPDNVSAWTPPPGSNDGKTQAALLACMNSLPTPGSN